MTGGANTLGRKQKGFSLIEVLVALVVIAIGLLGIAKMQVLALTETANASRRSIAAIEAASLVASMHANNYYWASGFAPASFTVVGTNISDPTLSQPVNCDNGAQCTAAQLAAYDVQQWAKELASVVPNPSSTIGCTNTPGVPVVCSIEISWSEQQMGVNQQGSGGPQMQAPTYILHVEP
jgi:type IV pilus assembly protein PilV